MDPQITATKYCFLIPGDDSSFFFFISFSFGFLLFYVVINFYENYFIIFIIIIIFCFFFFMKIIFIFSCAGMFRNVPACSGFYRRPSRSSLKRFKDINKQCNLNAMNRGKG